MLVPVISTICNDCGFRTKHSTRTRAFISMAAHETETSHDDQMYNTIRNGWVRFRALNYTNASVN